MYDTADALEDWHYSRLDADMEQAQWEREAREAARDRAEGRCDHPGGYLWREVAFYPQQVGLTPGQMWCYECKQAVENPNGPECIHCDLDRYNCMGERGFGDSCKNPHNAFTPPDMTLVSVAPPEGF